MRKWRTSSIPLPIGLSVGVAQTWTRVGELRSVHFSSTSSSVVVSVSRLWKASVTRRRKQTDRAGAYLLTPTRCLTLVVIEVFILQRK
jgi:hypothetical protein